MMLASWSLGASLLAGAAPQCTTLNLWLRASAGGHWLARSERFRGNTAHSPYNEMRASIILENFSHPYDPLYLVDPRQMSSESQGRPELDGAARVMHSGLATTLFTR